MRYMLLILEPPGQRRTRTQAEGRALYDRMLAYAETLRQEGRLVSTESLASHEDATRVEVRGGTPRVMDGPYAEAKEMVGGFFLVDCETREEAVALARHCPAAEWATVEVRALAPCYRESTA